MTQTPKRTFPEEEAPAARIEAEDDGPGDTASQGPSDLESTLTEAEAKRDEYLDLLQRTKADFENYRKRAARDQERLVAHAHERLVRELLPVLDDLERAAKPPIRDSELDRGNRVEVPPTAAEYAALVDGVRLVERSLRKALEKEGLTEIDTVGRFDPHVHEAVLARPADVAEQGEVLEVMQRGYRLGDKVVRPARVIVAE